jgi:hypothetical protein
MATMAGALYLKMRLAIAARFDRVAPGLSGFPFSRRQ